jgi:hypothetical protein
MTVRPFAVFAAVLSLAMTPLCAHADTLQTFQVQNSFDFIPSGSPAGSLTGTIVIDTTSGQFVSGDLTYIDSATTIHFNNSTLFTRTASNQVYTDFFAGANILNFDLSASSLVGYTGGPICGDIGPCPGFGYMTFNGDAYVWSHSGSLTPTDSPTPTPEPASFLLLGTGLLGLGASVKHRFMA